MAIYMMRDDTQTYAYSYDFRNKTIALMEADGWNFFYQKGYVTFNSNWINSSSSTDSIMVKMENLSSIMPSANKVTLSMTSNFSGYFSSRISLYNTATSSTRSGVTWNRAWSSQQQIQTTLYWTNATNSSNVSWNLTVTSVFDLVNWVWTTTGSNGYSDTWAISSTKIWNIRNDINWFYISAWWVDPGNSSWWLTSISLTIEI